MRHTAGLFAALLFFSSTAQAREIFVAPPGSGGDDGSGTGDIGAPYATLHHALSQAVANDVITLREGSYAGDATVGTPDLTIQSHPGEWAVIALRH